MSKNVNDIGLDSPRPAGGRDRKRQLNPTLSNLDDSQAVSRSQNKPNF